jgi:acyl-CoA reductase-like NAD-dependent aldehyde dehydrogenase
MSNTTTATRGHSTADAAMTIDGRAVKAERTFEVINPATGLRFAAAPDCTRPQVDDAMEAAARAFQTWRLDDSARREAMRTAADELESAAAELAGILTAEQGKPLRESLAEVDTTAVWLRWYAGLDTENEIVEDGPDRRIEVRRRPHGPVVAITPWNFPIQMAGKKAAQALRPGNTLIVKPSPYTPLATLRFVEVLQKAFPPGVLSAVTGVGSDLGTWLTEHPLTRKISFTGSTKVGKLVAAAAVPDLKRVTLELGGNDAAIVLDDADPETVGKGIFDKAFINCGQTCAAIKRAYVPERLYDDVVEVLARCAREAIVGDGMDPDTDFGPLNNQPQLRIVSDLVDDALHNGAQAVAGGEAQEGGGYFYQPTILANVEDGMRIVDEEQFGPALPVVPYSRVDDAVERANSSKYGLGGSVWTSDLQRGSEVASRLDCGTVWINTHARTDPAQPFAGSKWSGIGVENGRWGLYDFTQLQAIQTVF